MTTKPLVELQDTLGFGAIPVLAHRIDLMTDTSVPQA